MRIRNKIEGDASERNHLERRAERRALEWARCRLDPVFWVNRWCWTYDPRVQPSTLPFDLYDVQKDCLRWLVALDRDRTSGLIEKSRDMGATWLCGCFAVWRWLYCGGDATGFGSRKLELVDRLGDPDCIFEKIRFTVGNLPAWMRPPGYVPGLHSSLAKLINPANGSTITGEGGDNIGRGGRKSRYFVDEFAFTEHPALIDRALISTTDVRIDVSTPNGPGNSFAMKRAGGAVRVFTLHYSADPRKSPEWIAAKRATTDAVTWAQEYEIDYSASIEGIAIPARWVTAAIDLVDTPRFRSAFPNWTPAGDRGAGREPSTAVSMSRPIPTAFELRAGLDIAAGGKNKTVLTPRRSILVLPPVVEPFANLLPTDLANRVIEVCEAQSIRSVAYDVNGIGISVGNAWEARSRTSRLPMRITAVNSGAAPSEDVWPTGKKSSEMFRPQGGLRTELWWKVRARFERTYEFLVEGKEHPANSLISIPRCPDLIAQLSMPLAFRTEGGLIFMESKRQMQERGVQSPDFADSLIYSEMETTDWVSFAAAAEAANEPRQTLSDRARQPVPSGQPRIW